METFTYEQPEGAAHVVAKPDGAQPHPSVMARFAPLRKQQTRRSAFAPDREGNAVKAFATGHDYFIDVCKSIEQATRSVLIAGWQVNWAVRLSSQTRLIDALKKAVDNGARIYVMPWQSPKVGVNTGDLGTMLAVFQLNAGRTRPVAFCCPAGLQNDYDGMQETFFSHHQKLVIVDGKIAYVGGIDLAFGRNDDERFSLEHGWRSGPEVYNTGVPPAVELMPAEATRYVTETELLKTTLSAGWLNEAVQAQQSTSRSVAQSRLGEWSDNARRWWRESKLPEWMREPLDDLSEAVNAQARAVQNTACDRIIAKLEKGLLSHEDVLATTHAARAFMKAAYVSLVGMGWVGRRAHEELFKAGVQSSPGDAVYTQDQPRMPWQDVQVRIEGPSVYDLARNFHRRWQSLQKQYLPAWMAAVTRLPEELMPPKPAEGKGNGGQGGLMVRVLRSAPLKLQQEEAAAVPASVPPQGAQQEIHDAMVSAIQRAEHFIYIENQFFQSDFGEPSIDPSDEAARSGALQFLLSQAGKRMSAAVTRVDAPHKDLRPRNHIARAIAERIEHAIRWGQNFHAYMVLPVHPEGSLADLAIIGQVHWTMQSLVYGRQSLANRVRICLRAKQLCKEPRDPAQWEQAKHKAVQYIPSDQKLDYEQAVPLGAVSPYLTLLNLRNCQTVNGQLRTEQIYVHTKLLIVDDRLVIVGSANINDRSLSGQRDSELAVLMTDLSTQEVALDGHHSVKVRTLAHKLRMELWRKHFALHGGNDVVQPARALEAVLDKPADPSTWRAIQKIAESNASAYASAFHWVPHGMRSIWPAWPLGQKAPADPRASRTAPRESQYERDFQFGRPFEPTMPFSDDYWKQVPTASRPSGIQGFICALPMLWTLGENNHPGMNMILLTDNRTPSNDLQLTSASGTSVPPLELEG